MRSSLVLPAVLCACAVLSAPAEAATVSAAGGTLRVTAAAGERNDVQLYESDIEGAAAIAVRDADAPLAAGDGCSADPYDATAVTCGSEHVADVAVVLRGGDDRLRVDLDVPSSISGGDGDDDLTGGRDDDGIDGGRGYDRADGGYGADTILMRDRRADAVTCGAGRDRVRAEVLDSLDVECERVDYGRAGQVGRLRPVTGGGRFVPVPGQPWARVDRRILPNVLYLVRRHHVRIGDGFAMKGHERLGEHPLGLAVDLYPGAGGSWADVARLARWAEPRQNRPRWPFRWVGWNGDFNHGWGNHLHLSWAHSPGRPGRPVRTVWVFSIRR